MENQAQRLDYLEESNDQIAMQNRVLATALKGLIRALPQDIAQEVTESIQIAFEDEMAQLNYENPILAELFQDVADDFFRERG